MIYFLKKKKIYAFDIWNLREIVTEKKFKRRKLEVR